MPSEEPSTPRRLQIERAIERAAPGEVKPLDAEVEEAFDRMNDPPPAMVHPWHL
jgi:hypothetical protein